MDGIAETGQLIISNNQMRLELAAQNVANITTSGYKEQNSYTEILREKARAVDIDLNGPMPSQLTYPDMSSGSFNSTGNPLDIAIAGSGFFQLRTDDRMVYSRQGQFMLSTDGMVVNSQGHVLQGENGDLVIADASAEILADGTVLENGLPTDRIPIFNSISATPFSPMSGTVFVANEENVERVTEPMLRQGFIEGSNVSVSDQMVQMMEAIRQAETGARLVQVYDELAGKVLSTLGQAGR